MNYTSIRHVYIYGPLNYNPVEEWFFHRIAAGRPIPIPGSGQQVRLQGQGPGWPGQQVRLQGQGPGWSGQQVRLQVQGPGWPGQ